MPSFPIPSHIPREGEPPYPDLFTVRFKPIPNDAPGFDSYWVWRISQPDSYLLDEDMGLRFSWIHLHSNHTWNDAFSKMLLEQYHAIVGVYKKHGETDLLEKYWPDLLKFLDDNPLPR